MINALDNHIWDVVISDHSMPNFNGIEALSLLRQKNPDLPFIFVSGTLGEERAVMAMKAGANDYVMKNNLSRLVPALQRELREAQIKQEKKRITENLTLSESKFKQVFDSAAVGMAIVGIDGHFMQVNPSFAAILGYEPKTLLSRDHHSLVGKTDRTRSLRLFTKALTSKQRAIKIKLSYERPDHKLVWGLLNVLVIRNGLHTPLYILLELNDITKEILSEQRLLHLSEHDPLTNLPNRNTLKAALNGKLQSAKEKGENVVFILINIDRLYLINDAYGYEFGDNLIAAFADRIAHCVKKPTLFARISGDDFLVVLFNTVGTTDATILSHKLLKTFDAPFQINEKEISITASIGLGLFPTDGKTTTALLRSASAALYQSKNLGGNLYQYATQATNKHSEDILKKIADLRHAIQTDSFILYYQPKVDLKTGKIKSVEALVRWPKEDGSLCPPLEFITLAEECGLILQLGRQIFNKAFYQCHLWQELGYDLPVAINVSGHQFKESNLIQQLEHLLVQYDIKAHLIELEITESIAMDKIEHNINCMKKLKLMGFKLVMDDFGTGYSSLSYLTRFAIDILKIDKSFIDKIADAADHIAIIAAMIAMAKQLGIETVAEGVENATQVKVLREHGCDQIQGYYFSPPVPPESITAMLIADQQLK